MINLSVIAVDDIFDSSLALTLDILSTANQVSGKKYPVRICSDDGNPVTTAHGFTVPVDSGLQDCTSEDVFIVPGLGLTGKQEINDFLVGDTGQNLVRFLRQIHDQGGLIAASCSATFLVAETGLLDGYVSTTNWWLSDLFRARYPGISVEPGYMLTRAPGIICAGAAMAQADLVLALVSDIYGVETAGQVARLLLIDSRKYQSSYMLSGIVSSRHPEVARAELWVRDNLSKDFSVAELAAALGVSSRTLARRIDDALGQSPRRFIQQIRVEHAVHLLETTGKSFEEIAYESGYKNASSLRRVMVKTLGKSPAMIRHST